MEAHEATLKFQVSPEPRASRTVRERVASLAHACGVSEDDLDLFLTALGEALANAVEHGGRAEHEITIDVEVKINGNRIIGTVRDNGSGFTPKSAAAEPTLPDAHAERGRGLPIIRSCSDFFAVTSEPGKGTVVLLGRYFCPAAIEAVA
jgi:anti-sigma regulatory factor (Ser/Thr protein kinase)